MNIAESAAMEQTLKSLGWQPAKAADEASLVIINSCSVRITAERRVFGRLAHYKSLKKKLPLNVLLAGCMASRLGGDALEKGADYVLGANQKQFLPEIIREIEQKEPVTHIFTEKSQYTFANNHHKEGTFSSFVPIMHGCNNFCAYCIVPYVRGREISRSPADIATEIEALAAGKTCEIILLGQNVNSYCWENGAKPMRFPDLLQFIAGKIEGTPIKWVRFLSSHPKDFSSETIEVIAQNPCFCRHIHLCVQHGSNRVLQAMNRRYTREHYLGLVERIRGKMPEVSLSTDILVGFPGETEAEFEEILTLMEKVRFLYAYTYHYNPREGTAAFDLPDRIDKETKIRRLTRVMELQQTHTTEILTRRIGSTETVLVEGVSRRNPRELICRTGRDETVAAPGEASLVGAFARAAIASVKGNTFKGNLV